MNARNDRISRIAANTGCSTMRCRMKSISPSVVEKLFRSFGYPPIYGDHRAWEIDDCATHVRFPAMNKVFDAAPRQAWSPSDGVRAFSKSVSVSVDFPKRAPHGTRDKSSLISAATLSPGWANCQNFPRPATASTDACSQRPCRAPPGDEHPGAGGTGYHRTRHG